MKKLITLFFLLIPNYLFANEMSFNCVFSFSEYTNKQQPLNKELVRLMNLDTLKVFVDFTSISKNKWIIDDIYLENDLKQQLKTALESSADSFFSSFRKILYEEKLSISDKEFRNYIIKDAGISLSELNQLLRNLSKKEKQDLMFEYKKDYTKQISNFNKEFGPAIEDVTINQDEYFKNYINLFANYGETKVTEHKIRITTVTDSGMLIENIIDYKNLLKNKSTNSVSLKITFVDGNSMIFVSDCINKNSSTKKTDNINDDISSKLKKLKSLFEDELITQEEYDSKRKEILDEM